MFPFNSNIPYIKKNGKRTTLGSILGGLPDIPDEIDALDERITDLEDTTQNCWVIAAHDQSLTLSTADGTKTVADMLTEANTALRAIVIPDDYAYEIVGLVIANGDGNTSQVILDPSYSGQNLITNFSSFNLRGTRTIQQSSGASTAIYSLYLPDAMLTVYSVSIASKSIASSKTYGTEVPTSGTTTRIVYNLWKKL